MTLIKFNLENKNKSQIKTEILNKFNKIQDIVNSDRNYNEILYNIINHSLTKKKNIKINLDNYGNYKIIDNNNNKVLSGGLYNSIKLGGYPNNQSNFPNKSNEVHDEKHDEEHDEEQEEQDQESTEKQDEQDQESTEKQDEQEQDEQDEQDQESTEKQDEQDQESTEKQDEQDQESTEKKDEQEDPTEKSTHSNINKKIENVKSKIKNAGNILDSIDNESKTGSDNESKTESDNESKTESDIDKPTKTEPENKSFFSKMFSFGNNKSKEENEQQVKSDEKIIQEHHGIEDPQDTVGKLMPGVEGGYYSSDDENYLDDFHNQTLMFHEDEEEDNLLTHINNMTNKEYLNQLNYQDLRIIMKNNHMRLTNNGNYFSKKEMVNKIYNFYK